MCDLPPGVALLALARDVLLRDLMPLLPPEAHLEARLVANSMAIAEREAVAGEEPAQKILRELGMFYGAAATLTRFAHDLRVGAFEGSKPRERHARDMLWQLTLLKLRQANPRFLAANGFS